jgi:hypothetical protein
MEYEINPTRALTQFNMIDKRHKILQKRKETGVVMLHPPGVEPEPFATLQNGRQISYRWTIDAGLVSLFRWKI